MTPHRNLLILLPHGLRSDAISDDQSWPLRTPNLEGLAKRGLRMVATSACPEDCGGMVSLLTGLHARQHGVLRHQPAAALSTALPGWLSEVGYHVAGVGCVGMVERFLDESVLVEDVATLDPVRCAYWDEVHSKGLTPALEQQRRQRLRSGPFDPERLLLEPEDDVDGYIARQAIHVLEHMPGDRPWALFVIFSGPGNDLPPPTLYESVVEPTDLQHGFAPTDLSKVDALVEPAYPRVMLQRLEPYSIGRIRADYLGRVSLIDYAVGRLVSELRNRSDADKTWTAVASDRGHLLGEHGLIGRRSFLSGAMEVPLIIAPPEDADCEITPHADGLVSSVDIAITLAALGSCDIPSAAAGRSLVPLLGGETLLPQISGGNLSEFNDRLLLETERFKAVFNRANGQCLGLYDLLNDPEERDSLIEAPRGSNLVDALRWRLADALLPLRAEPVMPPAIKTSPSC